MVQPARKKNQQSQVQVDILKGVTNHPHPQRGDHPVTSTSAPSYPDIASVIHRNPQTEYRLLAAGKTDSNRYKNH